MSQPFKPLAFAALHQRALKHEEKGEWLKGAQVWRQAIKAAKTKSERFMANSRRDFCLRHLSLATQREAV